MFHDIKGFELYSIDRDGNVKSNRSGKLLSPNKNTGGYYQVVFSIDGTRHAFLLHRLLAYVFKDLPCLYSELQVDHIDGDINNYCLSNLQVLSEKDHLDKTLAQNNKEHMRTCEICNKKLNKRSYVRCLKCRKTKSEDLNITIDEVVYWVKNFSWVRASRELGMSDNGLRKFYRRHTGLDPKNLK